jgi:hypothetical protein
MQAAHVRLCRCAAGVHHDHSKTGGTSRLCRDLVAEHRDRAGAGRCGPGEPQAVGQHAVRPKMIGRAREWHTHFDPKAASKEQRKCQAREVRRGRWLTLT